MGALSAVLWKQRRVRPSDQVQWFRQALRPFGRAVQEALHDPVWLFAIEDVMSGSGAGPHQPLSGYNGRYTFVFDGRLDNRHDVVRRLNLPEPAATVMGDAEIAFRSWCEGGEAALRGWSGAFSFICWDIANNKLTAARDHLGLRPLCYHETPDRIVIASSVKVLLGLPDVERVIDEQKIADQLVQLFHDGERTYYRNIKRLLPGHLLVATPGRTNISRYWSLRDAPEVRYAKDDDYVQAARDLFNEVVAAQVTLDGTTGAFMSGGLDSSSVAVTALDHIPEDQTLSTFTWVPSKDWDGRCRQGTYGDETPFIESIVEMHPRLRPHFVRSEGHGLFHQLDDFLEFSGVAPRNAINLCWIHDIHIAARDRGLRVLMEGGGGNMALSWDGDGVLVERWQNRDYLNLCRDILTGPGGLKGVFRRSTHMLLFKLAPDWTYDAYCRLRGNASSLPLWQRFSAINPRFAKDMNVEDRMRHYGWDFFQRPIRNTHDARIKLMSETFMHEAADIHQAFRTLYGVETRDPFSDRRLLEWSLGLPEDQFRRFGEPRWLIRRMMKGKLPASVVDNRRVGEQVIDWHARLTWELPRLRDELETIADDPDTSRYLDVDLIRSYLDNWPSETPLNPKGRGYAFVPVSIGSAIAAARLVRRAKGANR